MESYRSIERCRICGNSKLISVLDLGEQVLSGIFPQSKDQIIPVTPLELVKCDLEGDQNACGLVQLKHSANVLDMYGTTYGYYSSLSRSMVGHLQNIVLKLAKTRKLKSGDAVLDIGCNDGTLLNLIDTPGVTKIGIDPSSTKFVDNFNEDVQLVAEFFDVDTIRREIGATKFHQITAIAMFYDLDEPIDFLKGIRSLLEKDGIWSIELAYLPAMLSNLVYDQICHEHVTYPSLSQIVWLANRTGLKIIDVEFNNINGGSFLVIGCRDDFDYPQQNHKLERILEEEKPLKTIHPFRLFKDRVFEHKKQVRNFFETTKLNGKTVVGYGASTKGNIVLNHCCIGPKLLTAIGDSNPEKWHRLTPGTNIPIISKEEMRKLNPDYLFVLIWHFHKEILEDEIEYVANGGKIVFDLPQLHVVDKSNYDLHLKNGFSHYCFPL